MADQEFVVGYFAGDKSNYLKVNASSVTQYGEKAEKQGIEGAILGRLTADL
jgi:hypothetical protein